MGEERARNTQPCDYHMIFMKNPETRWRDYNGGDHVNLDTRHSMGLGEGRIHIELHGDFGRVGLITVASADPSLDVDLLDLNVSCEKCGVSKCSLKNGGGSALN